jgi:hypothetical protein
MQAAEGARAAGGEQELPLLKVRRDELRQELETLQQLELFLASQFANPSRVVTRAKRRVLLDEEEETQKRFRFDAETDRRLRALLLAATVRPDVQERFLGTGGLRHDVVAQGVRPLPANMQQTFLESIPSEKSVMRMLDRGGTMATDNNFAAFRFCVAQNYTTCVSKFLQSPALNSFFAAKIETDGGEEFVWKLFLQGMLMDYDLFDTGLEGVWLVLMDPRCASWVPSDQFVWRFVELWQDFYDKTSTRGNMFSALLTELVRRQPGPLTTNFFVNLLALPRLFLEETLIVALQDPRFNTQELILQMMEDGEGDVLQFVLLTPGVPRDARSVVTQEMIVHINTHGGDKGASECLQVVLSDSRTVVTNAQGLLDLFWESGKLSTARVLYVYLKRSGRFGEVVLTSQQEAALNPQRFASLVRKGKF